MLKSEPPSDPLPEYAPELGAYSSLPLSFDERQERTVAKKEATSIGTRLSPALGIGGDKTGADIRKIRSSLRKKNLFLCALASKQSLRLALSY